MKEEKIKLLWNSATSLSSRSHASLLLKSYYMNNCRKVTKICASEQGCVALQMCPKCSCYWSEAGFNIKLRPQHIATSTKSRNLIAKLDSPNVTLNKKQRRRAKLLKKKTMSDVIIKCKFCDHNTHVALEKAIECKQKKSEVSLMNTRNTDLIADVKENKRQKVAPTLLDSSRKSSIPNANPKKRKAGLITDVKENKKQKVAPILLDSSRKSSIPNANNLKKKKAVKKSNLIAPKIQSKTQRQNNLVQLAGLLKAQATKSLAKPQNRILSLLK